MNQEDLQIAFALERELTGGNTPLACGCVVEIFCTMPITYWLRVKKPITRCEQHRRKKRLPPIGVTVTNNMVREVHDPRLYSNLRRVEIEDPRSLYAHGILWITREANPIKLDVFTATFRELTSSGQLPLVQGLMYDFGRQRAPSVVSFEGTHYIIESGRTGKVPSQTPRELRIYE